MAVDRNRVSKVARKAVTKRLPAAGKPKVIEKSMRLSVAGELINVNLQVGFATLIVGPPRPPKIFELIVRIHDDAPPVQHMRAAIVRGPSKPPQ